ncbi:cyclin-dependent kinases regulatory subunit isoform X1 [Hydra vulgaris]|uniref:Cyclin-dependent kinases regulatory subunit n=1 Tax=Hydra vulgaris TaxID=6087 RepID=A0ABM4DEB9_HYDVU|nr:cyclin-dependent kinases regulatory subunit [Hydra vulgaris]
MTTHNNIYYSDRYADDENEYRHVIIPKELAKKIPKDRYLTEEEWRSLGIQQSQGWIHYMHHKPEPHILMFKRPKCQ